MISVEISTLAKETCLPGKSSVQVGNMDAKCSKMGSKCTQAPQRGEYIITTVHSFSSIVWLKLPSERTGTALGIAATRNPNKVNTANARAQKRIVLVVTALRATNAGSYVYVCVLLHYMRSKIFHIIVIIRTTTDSVLIYIYPSSHRLNADSRMACAACAKGWREL